MVQHPGVVCSRLRPLPSHCLPQTLQDVQIELFIDCHHVEQTHNEPYPSHKKILSTSPLHLSDSDVLYLAVATISSSIATTALLFQHRSRTPKSSKHLTWADFNLCTQQLSPMYHLEEGNIESSRNRYFLKNKNVRMVQLSPKTSNIARV